MDIWKTAYSLDGNDKVSWNFLVEKGVEPMRYNENVMENAREESEREAIYDGVLAEYKESGHFAEDVAHEIDEAIEQFKRENTKPKFERTFVINQPVQIEETRNAEFKEVKGQNPISSI